MHQLQTRLRETISSYIEQASRDEIIAITGLICAPDPAPPAYTAATHITDRFELIDSDQVLDYQTDLIWSRGNVPGGKMNWKAAQNACSEYRLGGHSDWRLPTIKELLSLVDYDRHSPAIDPAFTCEKDYYWSSTPYAPNPGGCAWIVGFDDGNAGCSGQDFSSFVRAVRPRQ